MSALVERLLGKEDPGYPVIVEDGTEWSLETFREKVNRLASTMVQKGIQPGDRVALMFLNQKEFLLGYFAVLHAGGVVVPINIQLPPDDIVYVLLNSGSKLILTTDSFAPRFEGKPIPILVANQPDAAESRYPSLEAAVEAGDPNFAGATVADEPSLRVLMYTSGTTGKPKGVMLSEQNLLANLDDIRPALQIHTGERLLLALPLFHAYGLIIALYALDQQAPLFLVPNFAPKKIIQTVVENRVAILPLVPTMFSLLMHSIQRMGPEPFEHLKVCVSGGASLPEPLMRQIETALDLVVLEGYGLTETSPVLAVNRRDRGSIPKSVGRPLDSVSVKLVDDAGKAIPVTPGEESAEGEILVKGPNVMMGYYQLPEETAKAFDAEGYFRTGDLGRFDAEGNLYISGGRKKDLIIKAGENIAPVRIEEVLHLHPSIQNVSVIGIPDDKLGEEIMACIEPAPGAELSEAEIKRFAREYLPPFMMPGLVRFYAELPKNPAGKVLKNQLREENTQLLKH